jgi:hypothetical protein
MTGIFLSNSQEYETEFTVIPVGILTMSFSIGVVGFNLNFIIHHLEEKRF